MSGEEPNGPPTLLDALDRTVHEPARLAILVLLQAIESAGLIEFEKTFVDRTPRTLYRISDRGRKALAGWRAAVLGVVAELDGNESG